MLTVNTNPLELVFKKLVLALVALVSGQPHTYAQNEIAIAESQSSLTLEEHKLFESRVRKVIHDVSPTVVAVESPLGGITKKIGHPFGYRADRRHVARLGTVIYKGEHVDLVADCQVDGGDSGGPLIDMQGRLLGIAEATSAPFVATWIMSARSGPPFNHHDTSTIANFLTAIKSTGNAPVEELDLSEKHDRKKLLQQKLEESLHPANQSILNPQDWTQGYKNLSLWYSQSNLYSEKLVQLYRNQIPSAFGTCVAKGGWVISKASELGDVPQFQTKSGQFADARIVATDFESDLALLRVELELQPVDWHVSPEPIGTFVVTPDAHGQPMLSGIVSVATRKIANRKMAEEIVAPGRTTIPVSLDILPYFDRRGVVVNHVRNDTAEKGLKNGDVILKMDDVEMTNPEEMNNYASTVAESEEVAITVRRNDEVQIYKVHFSPLPYFECPGAISPYANMRCDDFPEVFEHDMPLALNECGGPVVALDGKALGINIARVGDHGSMAIPASAIIAQVEKWQRFIDPASVSVAASEDDRYSIPIRVVLLICICCLSIAGLYIWKKRTCITD